MERFKKAQKSKDLLESYDWITRGIKEATEHQDASFTTVVLRKNLTDNTIIIPHEFSAEFIDIVKEFLEKKLEKVENDLENL